MSGVWRHTCVVCGSLFFGPRCRIACNLCRDSGAARAHGRCLECGAPVPERFLFCRPCFAERRRLSRKPARKMRHHSMIVAAPVYEESVFGRLVTEEN